MKPLSSWGVRSLEKAEALFRDQKYTEGRSHLVKALKDPYNLDACILLAMNCGTESQALLILEQTERKGRRLLRQHLGEDCFHDDSPYVGHFWSELSTRPYMRVLDALVRLYLKQKQYPKCIDSMIEMLRLCPGDNFINRAWLGPNLIRIGRYSDALFFAQSRLRENGKTPINGGITFSIPRSGLLSSEKENNILNYSKYFPGGISLMYTAALASFKLWGDCPSAQQYLKMSVTLSPHVMMRVLGGISRPAHPHKLARVPNSTEDAHDYLWLSQDLWEEYEVLGWIKKLLDNEPLLLKRCSNPSCPVIEAEITEFKRCSSCHLVHYCSESCQSGHWRIHKPDCKMDKKVNQSLRKFQKGEQLPKGSKIPFFTADFSRGNAILAELPKKK
ncbi:hypothetical protein BDQ12DRAFT_716026 [Crucibulum laeve]|uniref:MYND-type domain-containing protein n=1 Tax=Crucibulum laeve TaxID=68775 RepID=A0A5C3LK46_9AGAR|nr:hypothetical protein BDQ12DRAFT_716026 [Crucibulum laeve]